MESKEMESKEVESRKIIEIYAEDDNENDCVYVNVERKEDSKVANSVMQMILNMLNKYPGDFKNVTYTTDENEKKEDENNE